MNVVFWKNREKGEIDPLLFSKTADELAQKLAKESEESRQKLNKRTQLRKFYDEVIRLENASMERRPEFGTVLLENVARERNSEWTTVLPMVHMLTAKAAYARGRGLISDSFLTFIKESVSQTQTINDLRVFSSFFEAVIGFYTQYEPKK